ncbi:MAG: zinc ABC transporter substrate-binding protein [Planctomycetaceae bacterium]|nr:zinc ABC transporter substrate-binding protein [Planctomycetaceae bacterium]
MIILRALLTTAVLLLAACVADDRQTSSADLSTAESKSGLVVASNYPLYFFARRIAAGVDAAPEIVLPEFEGDPAEWVPNAEQIQILQVADVVLLNGAGAESWLDLISIDQGRLLDTSTNIADKLIALDDSAVHQHGPDGEHSHQGTAFTIWLDPKLAIEQARVVLNSLVRLAPSGEAGFRDNMANLEQELNSLDEQLDDVFAKLEGQPVLFSHPVYQYMQRRFGVNGQSLHWEPGQDLSTSDWIDMQQMLVSHPSSLMIWEDSPSALTSERLIEAGITPVIFQTVADKPEQGDFLSAMQQNAKRLDSNL